MQHTTFQIRYRLQNKVNGRFNDSGVIIFFLTFFVFAQFAFGQQIITIIDENSKPFLINDTLFIKKDSIYSIFIDTSKKSDYYERLADFSMEDYEKDSYEKSLKYLKAKNTGLTKQNLDKVPRKWRDLYQYNGEYYIYYPCDLCSNYRISITDTAFVEYMCDGAIANKIQEYKNLDDSTFHFRTTAYFGSDDRLLTIYLIDSVKGIAVFQTEYLISGYSRYDLMIDVEKIREFPVIVNKCDYTKVLEMNFQYPDLKKLIKDRIP